MLKRNHNFNCHKFGHKTNVNTMSTKLYNGIKFKSNKLSTVIRQLNSLKEEARKRVMETFEDERSSNFLYMCLKYAEYVGKGLDVNTCFKFERQLYHDLSKPYSDFDVDFKVTIFERKNKLYGTYFDHTRKNYKDLFDKGIAVNYHYQDQTDKPDNISWRDWNFREKVWSDIFDDIDSLWRPKEAGVTYDIVSADDIIITDEILEKVKKKVEEFKN